MSKSVNGGHATTDRLSERAHETVDQAAKSAGKAEERIRDGAAEAETRVRHAGQKAKARTDETLHSIGTFVQDNPLMSLGIAFAAGTLLSALRRRS